LIIFGHSNNYAEDTIFFTYIKGGTNVVFKKRN